MTDRSNYLGASDVGAIFGVHPFKTKYALWMDKAGRMPRDDRDTDAAERGRFLEPAVATWAAHREGWTLRQWPQDQRVMHPTIPRFGCTPDYERTDKPGWVEIKVPISFAARKWMDDEPPLYWQLQLQSQLGIKGYAWGALAVLVGDRAPLIYPYKFRPAAFAKIEAGVAEFWASIDVGTPPPPDWTADAATVARIYAASVKGKTLDLTGDNRLPILADEYLAAAAEAKAAEARKDAARAEILAKIGDADLATCGAYRIGATAVSPSLGTLVTPEMVGSHVGGRAGYRTMRITRKEPK